MPSSSTFFQPCYISSFYRPLLHNARGNVRFYLVVWLFSKRPLSISLGINCLCMHYTNTKVCRSLLSWNHARNPIEDDLHYRVFKTILSQKQKNGQNSAVYFWNAAIPVSKQLSRTPCNIGSNRHYKMSSTYKIHLPNGKSWLTLQKRGNSNIISSVLHYFS